MGAGDAVTGSGMNVAVRVGFVLLTAAALQRGLFSEVRIAGAAIDVLLALAVVGGMVIGPDRGAVLGFFAGLTMDLLAQTPLGLSALTYCLAAFAAGRLCGETARSNRLVGLALIAGVSAATVGAYAVAAEVLDQADAVSGHLPVIIAVVAMGNVVLSPLTRRAVRWAWPVDEGMRPALR